MSLKKISEQSGVAISTVSHVLNGTAKISDDVRQRVLQIAKDIGYLDSRIKRAQTATLRKIALFVDSERLRQTDVNFVSWTILETLRKECEQKGVEIEPVLIDEIKGDYNKISERMTKTKCDGILVYFDENQKLLNEVINTALPCILLAGQEPGMHIGSVGIGDRNGARLGVEHLIELGHRNIGIVSWPGRYTIRQRLDGFKEAINEHLELGITTTSIQLDSFQPDIAEKGMTEWLEQNPDLNQVTAFFCLADNVAIGVLNALQKKGIQVPKDVSILGFDDVFAGQMMQPALSTVHTPLHHIARCALEELELLTRRTSKNAPARRVELGCRLIERQSCKAV